MKHPGLILLIVFLLAVLALGIWLFTAGMSAVPVLGARPL